VRKQEIRLLERGQHAIGYRCRQLGRGDIVEHDDKLVTAQARHGRPDRVACNTIVDPQIQPEPRRDFGE